jgi:hypothetical protein
MTKEDFKIIDVGVSFILDRIKYNVVNVNRHSPAVGFHALTEDCKKGVYVGIDNDCITMTYIIPGSNTSSNYASGYKLKDIQLMNLEDRSIEYFQKKIEDTKYELNRLENTLKGLQESKRMKELTETLSNLIVGDFYTVNVSDIIFTGKYIGTNADKSHTFYLLTNNNYTASQRHIKQIIHRPNFSNEYRILLKKIDTFNSDLENA